MRLAQPARDDLRELADVDVSREQQPARPRGRRAALGHDVGQVHRLGAGGGTPAAEIQWCGARTPITSGAEFDSLAQLHDFEKDYRLLRNHVSELDCQPLRLT